MKISYDWLQSFFEKKLPSPLKLAELLEAHAFEVEGVDGEGKEAVLDVNITANRAHDCLSHRGIAKEFSVILKEPLKSDPLRAEVPLLPESKVLSVGIEDPSLCLRYSAAVIEGVKVGPSPDWLKERLELIGQRSINNVVDATNYVMFHVGQPLHAFDADKLTKSADMLDILVRGAKEGEEIETLGKNKYTLPLKTLLITDGESGKALGIAGVKGGIQAEVDKNTTTIVIESANFDRVAIRKTSKALKLRTDASLRFENELSPELTAYALEFVVAVVLDVAGGKLEGYTDEYPNPQKVNYAEVSIVQINELLGTDIKKGEAIDILKSLDFRVTEESGIITAVPPFERLDIGIAEDLIEEVGRIYGYDKVIPVVPTKAPLKEINKRFYWSEKIREFLVAEGFSEIFTSSFRDKDKVKLANALASDKSFMRGSLLKNLEEALKLNFHNAPLLGLSMVKIFEIGTVFDEKGEYFSLAFGVTASKASVAQKEVERIKAHLEKELGVSLSEKEEKGILEINLDELLKKLPDPKAYDVKPDLKEVTVERFSMYPFILRDIALWVPKEVGEGDVRDVITQSGGEYLIRTDMFDSFEKNGKISYAFHLVFQSKEKTLSDEEIGKVMEKITSTLTTLGYEVR